MASKKSVYFKVSYLKKKFSRLSLKFTFPPELRQTITKTCIQKRRWIWVFNSDDPSLSISATKATGFSRIHSASSLTSFLCGIFFYHLRTRAMIQVMPKKVYTEHWNRVNRVIKYMKNYLSVLIQARWSIDQYSNSNFICSFNLRSCLSPS